VFQAADDLVARSASAQRLAAATTGVFAAAAVLLAAVGLYGLVAGWVAQRSRELGVRVALGASGADIQRLVLGQGIRLALCGVLLGTIAYLLAHKVVEGILFAVSPTDPFIIGVTLAGLIAVAMVACFWPARRATKVDPMIALRAE
jgi:ABC-type antimicrobial peptide transport system permease subunit